MYNYEIMMPTIDVIGDIHGYADKLRRLLSRLGYEQSGGIYRSPDRRAIFVGDLIDRGPAIGEVMEIVAGMLRERAAQVVMGNHEFNALCFHRPDGKGGYLRLHTEKNCAQHAEIRATREFRRKELLDKWLVYLGVATFIVLPGAAYLYL
jgi:hypothetical protein